MTPFFNDIENWISWFEKTKVFQCESSGINCTNFHVLSPILQELDINPTYSSYPSPIIKIVNQLITGNKKINILVTGVESEYSARDLLFILELFRNQFTIKFIDICETPLKRIDAILKSNELNFVSTMKANLESDDLSFLHNKFDIVFSDLFIKQFPKDRKINLLNTISKFLKDYNSAVVIRENIGNIDEIIDRWSTLHNISTEDELEKIFKHQESKDKFKSMLVDLIEEFKNTGYVYQNLEDLEADIDQSRLQINNRYFNRGMYHHILHLTKKL